MPSVRIPLVGVGNFRNPNKLNTLQANKDQRFRACVFETVDNPITQTRTAYVSKRSGLAVNATEDAGNYGISINSTENGTITVYDSGSNTHRVFSGSTFCGATDTGDRIFHIDSALVGGVLHFMMSGADDGAYYLSNTGLSGGTTFTADTSNGSAVLANVSSTTGLVIGQKLSGTGIASSARIQSIDSGTQVTMTANATATNNTVTITRERMSKIIDSDFPSVIGPMVELDGYIFAATKDGKIYNSDLNSISSWSAINYISTDMDADELCGLVKLGNRIAGLGVRGYEVFFNGGNAAGSPLSRAGEGFRKIGCLLGTAHTHGSPISSIGETTAWISYEPAVYIVSNGLPKRVSNGDIEALLKSAIGSVFVDVFYYLQRPFLHVASGTSAGVTFSYWYDVYNNIWTETNFSILPRLSGNGQAVGVAINDNDGKYFLLNKIDASSPTYQDDSGAYSMVIQMSRQDYGNGNRKFLKSIELVADTQASGTTTLEISKDDFATFTTIGTFDMTAAKKIIYRCGSFTGGASLRLTHSANTAWRGEALIVEYEVGVH
jgi:hypothetical protein